MSRIAHVNLMVDTVVANLEADSLRAVIRSMLAEDVSGDLTRTLVEHSRRHVQSSLQRQLNKPEPAFFSKGAAQASTKPREHEGQPASRDASTTAAERISTTPALRARRREAMVTLGCGLAFESVSLYTPIVEQVFEITSPGYDYKTRHQNGPQGEQQLTNGAGQEEEEERFDEEAEDALYDEFAAVDSDIVQALTAVQKVITGNQFGKRELSAAQRSAVTGLRDALIRCSLQCESSGREFMFERGRAMIDQFALQ